MAYATEAEVEGNMSQFTIDGSSAPDSTELLVIINDVAGEIDTALEAAGVNTPITTPGFFLDFLSGLNSAGATARALKSMFPDATGAGETPAYAFWYRVYMDGLKGIKDGTMIPPGLTPSGANVAPSTYFNRNPDVDEVLGEIAEPFFLRRKVF